VDAKKKWPGHRLDRGTECDKALPARHQNKKGVFPLALTAPKGKGNDVRDARLKAGGPFNRLTERLPLGWTKTVDTTSRPFDQKVPLSRGGTEQEKKGREQPDVFGGGGEPARATDVNFMTKLVGRVHGSTKARAVKKGAAPDRVPL